MRNYAIRAQLLTWTTCNSISKNLSILFCPAVPHNRTYRLQFKIFERDLMILRCLGNHLSNDLHLLYRYLVAWQLLSQECKYI